MTLQNGCNVKSHQIQSLFYTRLRVSISQFLNLRQYKERNHTTFTDAVPEFLFKALPLPSLLPVIIDQDQRQKCRLHKQTGTVS